MSVSARVAPSRSLPVPPSVPFWNSLGWRRSRNPSRSVTGAWKVSVNPTEVTVLASVRGQGLGGLCKMPCRSSGRERMIVSMWACSLARVPGLTGSGSFSACVYNKIKQTRVKIFVTRLSGLLDSDWPAVFKSSKVQRFTSKPQKGKELTSFSFSLSTRSTVSTSVCFCILSWRSSSHSASRWRASSFCIISFLRFLNQPSKFGDLRNCLGEATLVLTSGH